MKTYLVSFFHQKSSTQFGFGNAVAHWSGVPTADDIRSFEDYARESRGYTACTVIAFTETTP